MNRSPACRYYVEFGAAMVGYCLALVASVLLLGTGQVADQWRWVVALLPVAPMVLIAIAVLRQLKRIDELQRKIQFEALAMAFAGTALITFSYGFLENVGFPKLSTFGIWPIMAGLWIVALQVVRFRYR